MLKEIKLINIKKATTFNAIPPKILKFSSGCSANILKLLVNKPLKTGKSLSNLKAIVNF